MSHGEVSRVLPRTAHGVGGNYCTQSHSGVCDSGSASTPGFNTVRLMSGRHSGYRSRIRAHIEHRGAFVARKITLSTCNIGRSSKHQLTFKYMNI
jgi:hypothetical protein